MPIFVGLKMMKDENHIEKSATGLLRSISRFRNTLGKLVQDCETGAMDMFYRYKRDVQFRGLCRQQAVCIQRQGK